MTDADRLIHDIPPRFRALVLSDDLVLDPAVRAAIDRVIAGLDGPPGVPRPCLFMHGTCGTGKTAAVARAVVEVRLLADARFAAWRREVDEMPGETRGARIARPRLPRATFTTDRGFLAAMRSTMAKDGERYDRALAEHLAADLVTLDDIGSGVAATTTAWEAATLGEFVDAAYMAGKAVILTSNRDLEGLGALLGDRVPSRIAEMGQVLRVRGADRRLAPTLTAAAWSTGRDGSHAAEDHRSHPTTTPHQSATPMQPTPSSRMEETPAGPEMGPRQAPNATRTPA